MKEPDYVMKIMASWMTLDELEDTSTRRELIDISGTNKKKQFIYRHPFGIYSRYIHQADDHNNQRHAQIYLERIWATNFWPDHNFAWYLAVSDVNIDLASGHFKNDGLVQSSLYFYRALAI